MEYVDNGGGYVCVGVGSIWEIFVHFSQSYYKPKMSLKKNKIKSLKKSTTWRHWGGYRNVKSYGARIREIGGPLPNRLIP